MNNQIDPYGEEKAEEEEEKENEDGEKSPFVAYVDSIKKRGKNMRVCRIP